jgi:gliding motility-associated-like protein
MNKMNMRTNYLIFFWAFLSSFFYGQTFQKFIQSTNNSTFTGMYSNSLAFDPISNSIFLQADQHNGINTPPGLMKLDTCGTVIWTRHTNPIGTVFSRNGGYFNGGYTLMSSTDINFTGFVSHFLNYDGSGNLLSSTTLNSSASSVIDLHLVGLKVLPNGDMLVTGYGPRTNNFKDIYFGKVSATGSFIWGGYTGGFDTFWENGWDCDYDPVNSDCYFVGQNISFSQTGSTDIHILKTDINGTMLWEKNIATSGSDVGWSVKVLPNQDVVIVGITDNNVSANQEICFIRLSSSGALLTSCKYQASGPRNNVRHVNSLPNGNLLLTGYTDNFGFGGLDALLMEVDVNGNIVWQKAYGTTDDDSFINSVVLNNNAIFTAGSRDVGSTGGTGLQVYIVKTRLDGTFDDPNCPFTNGNFVKINETFSVFDTTNILNSGLNQAVSFTDFTVTTSQTLSCGGAPTASFTAPISVCEFQPVLLVNQSLNANSWLWSSTANNIPNPTLQNQTSITFSTSGVYTIQLIASNCLTADTIQQVISVGIGINSPTSNSPLCSGNTLSLSVGGSTNCLWTGPNSFSSTIQNPIIPNAQLTNSGTYSVSSTSSLGCTSIGTINVVVAQTPTVSILPLGNNPLCAGKSLTLSANGAANYIWIPSGVNTTSIVISPSITTTYTLIGSSSIANCTNSNVITVIVNPSPIISIAPTIPVCEGKTLTINAVISDPFVWSGPSFYTSNNQNPVVNNAQSFNSGIYTVTATNALGCSSTSTVNALVVPNPTVNVLAFGNNPLCNGQSINLVANGASSYVWLNNGSSIPSITVTPSTTTTYTLFGQTAIGNCSHTAVWTVSVNPLPVISPTINSPICAGKTLSLMVNGTNNYLWTGPNTFSTNTQNPVISNAQPINSGVYVLNAMNGFGCTSSATLNAQVIPNPTISIIASGNNPLCSGQGINLFATGAANYTWLPGGANFPTMIFTPPISTTYTLIGVSSVANCSNSSMYTVSVNITPTLSVAGKTSVCVGESSTFTVSGANSYVWSIGVTQQIVTVNPLETKTYSITGSNASSTCLASKIITLTVNPIPAITINGLNDICVGQKAVLTPTGLAVDSYTWAVFNTNEPLSVFPTTKTTYSLTATSLAGCVGYGDHVINVTPIPTLSIAGNTAVCKGSPVTLRVSGADRYYWTKDVENAVYTFTPTGNQVINVIGSAFIGCTATATVAVVVNPIPVADFVVDSAFVDCNYQYQISGIRDLIITNYQWYVNSDFKSNADELYVTLGQEKQSVITLKVTNQFGCKNETKKIIKTDDLFADLIYVPNSFSPNDDGLNDTWRVMGECFEMQACYIYNRWGELIYTLKNNTDTWDGRFKGQPVKDGVYNYKIIGKLYNNGNIFEKTGVITVLN